MAIFNLDYYGGTNLYSDGDVEDVILNIVKNGQDYTSYVGSDNYYPIMYHLSPERENILNWYPFKERDTILEVGSGCGAITGLLCQKTKWVTSVELSKRRAEINYERHKSCDNLEIIVGNLNEVNLDKKYDYVILTGVFEYAFSFTDSEEPYVAFLNNLKKYLAEDGKILISIENRLGVKYFAGALEDHTNEYYLGLKNYPNNKTVRTFTKTELEEIFRKCNMSVWKFYYPYPDYKFPTEIFTDENINSDSYGRVYRNYQRDRLEIFNEIEMIKTFKDEEIMDVFSNSFMVEVSIKELPLSDVVYAKLNSTRKEEFCISTTILRDEAGYRVEKTALNKAAISHIGHIYANQEKSLPKNFQYLKGSLQGNTVKYPYLQLENMDACLRKMLNEDRTEEIKKKIDEIYCSIMNEASMAENFCNEEFKKYFGNVPYEGSLKCVLNYNIDLIFDNLYPTDAGYIVIDPEWVCHFPVPAQFIVWRMLNEWYAKYSVADRILPHRELYAEYGITEEMAQIFREWAVCFATQFVANCDLDNAVIPIKKIDLNQIIKSYDKDVIWSSLYVDYGEGFSEAEKFNIKVELYDGQFGFKIILDSSKTINALRWDPIEFNFCRCNIQKCALDKAEVTAVPVNADAQDVALFLHMDPQFAIEFTPGNYSELEIRGTFEYLDNPFVYEAIRKVKQYNSILQATNDVLRNENETLLSEKDAIRIQNENLNIEFCTVREKLENVENELKAIKNSRGWRALGIWRKLRGFGENV